MTTSPSPLEELLAQCPEPIFVASAEGAILRASGSFERLLGEGARVGTRLKDIVHSSDWGAFEASVARLRDGQEPVPVRCRLRDAEGAYLGFLVALRRAPDSGNIYGSLRPDERRTKLRTQVQLLQTILDNVPIIVWALDTQGVYTYHDGKEAEHLGLQPGQVIGQSAFDVHPDLAESGASVKRALAGETQHHIDQINGAWWETWEMPVHDEQGEVTAVVGVTLNVSGAKRAEEELRAKLELIERQQRVIRALSTPIIQVWDNVLTLPMVGVIDSARASEIMQSLLNEVVRTRARYAILDMTGVDAIDTATASHLLSLIRAIQLLGAEGIVTGLQPSIAQTIVGLGVDLSGILTLATLREGLKLCMRRMSGGG
jgi:rsbT co-antagonist protein RsbR